jgi:periplasmic protein TonB
MTKFTAERRAEWKRWLLSGAIVVLAHGGFAAAMVHWRDMDDPDDPASAMVVDLAPYLAAPSRQSERPPGPEQEFAEATPDKPDKPVEKVEETLEEKIETAEVREPEPEISPTPEAEPEIVLAALPPKTEPEPQPVVQDETRPETAPSAPPVAPSPVAVAPTQGQLNVSNSNARTTWTRQVVALIERNKRYPSGARGAIGTAQLSFSLDRQGRVIDTRIIKSSGNSALDQEVLDLVKRAQPFPTAPTDMSGEKFPLTVPVVFTPPK